MLQVALLERTVSRSVVVFQLRGLSIRDHRLRKAAPPLVKTGAELLTERIFCLSSQKLFHAYEREQFRGWFRVSGY